jgi:hypothetical protein
MMKFWNSPSGVENYAILLLSWPQCTFSLSVDNRQSLKLLNHDHNLIQEM